MAAFDPTVPLRNQREEAFAQERSLGYGPTECARRLGWNPRSGVGSKYDAKPRIQARVAALRRSDIADALRIAKREQIESRLDLIASFNLFDFVKRSDGKLDNGQPEIDWDRLSESEYGIAVSELRFDKESGNLVAFKRDDRLAALGQLRDMHGFKAAEKREVTVHDANRMSDDELARIAASGGAGAPASPGAA